MARESKDVKTCPNKASIDIEIKLQERWGWRLEGQKHESAKKLGDESQKQTNTYVILTFSRDQNMACYDEIVKMEEQYNQGFNKTKPSVPIFNAKYPDKSFKINIGWLITLLVVSFIICMFTVGLVKQNRNGIIATVIIEILIIASVLVYDIVKFNKRRRTYLSDLVYYNAIKAEMPKLINEYNNKLLDYEKALSEFNDLPFKAEKLVRGN